MIVGIGLDLIELDRIEKTWERQGMRFADKVLTDAEIAQLPKSPVSRLAALFAAKEAAVKALGTGFADGVTFQGVEIIHTASGKPEVSFSGEAQKVMEKLGGKRAHVTITHSRDNAAAVVIIES
ncbi:holo-[acyl-carrier-protein] synthase [Salidesulfovibrio brasiliensis]|uniref:holo-[acyl-carrier-protein] synthase n=1 Tax=Salidesulfovibrio brasiliensis TaxID=221711 RepID=UPI0006D146FA|nr:holo-[acyl-carrier-protein] synthase [Salidesulfovibrio brasiliensis]